MRHINTYTSKKRYNIKEAFDKKQVDEFYLLNASYVIARRPCEIWWYGKDNTNNICINALKPPYALYFFQLEAGDLFHAEMGKKAVETGIMPAPGYEPITNDSNN